MKGDISEFHILKMRLATKRPSIPNAKPRKKSPPRREEAFGDRLAAEIARLGVSKSEFSRRVDVSAQMLQRWLRGVVPKHEALVRISLETGASIDELLGVGASDRDRRRGGRGTKRAAFDLVVRQLRRSHPELTSEYIADALGDEHAVWRRLLRYCEGRLALRHAAENLRVAERVLQRLEDGVFASALEKVEAPAGSRRWGKAIRKDSAVRVDESMRELAERSKQLPITRRR